MRAALRILDISIGVAGFVFDGVRRARKRVARWPMPEEPVRTDDLAYRSNGDIDSLLSRDSNTRRQ